MPKTVEAPSNTPKSPTDRWKGALVGLAVGDALGTTLEFHPPGSFEPIADMVGGGPFRLRPGEWTDDTSMALCLAESLVATGGFDPADQIRRYVKWYRQGHLSSTGRCFDIGITVSGALRRFEAGGEAFAGSAEERTAGNGSIMRLAPVPMLYATDPESAIHYSGESSRTTHQNRMCIDACRYFGGLIAGALTGAAKDDLLSKRYSPAGDSWTRHPLRQEIDDIAAGSFKRKEPPEIQGTGFVVKSLEAALWSFHHAVDFADGCLRAVNLGDDADTTGAVYGQIAGAYYGYSGIPTGWRNRIAQHDMIVDFAKRLMPESIPAR